MLTRLNTDGSTGQETMSLLNELHKAQEEIKNLKQEVNTLRETIAQISPTQPPQSKKRREDPIPYKTTTGPISGTSKVVTSEVVSTKTTFKKPTNKAGGTLRYNEDREASEISTNAISSVHFKYLDELFHSWCTGKSSGEPRTRNQPRSSQATTGTNKESSKSKPVTASEHPRSATAIAGTSKESPGVETWATVAGRKTKNSNKTVGQGSRTTSGKKAPEQPKPKTTKRKTPNSAAVSITCENGQYQEILKMAKDRIDLKKLGIDSLRPKRGITGSIIYEIKGDNHNEKAKVRIACPQKTADIRIRDLDDYTRKDDVINAVLTSFETCRQEDLKLGEIRRSYNGLYTTVLKCPVAVANQLIEKKRIQIGWVSARIEALPARPLQCFRCLQKGHVRENCNSPIDRSNSCFRCGETNHTAVTCKNLPKCLICEELKKPFRHKMGGPACNAKTNRRQPRTQSASNTNRQDDGNPPQLSKEVMERLVARRRPCTRNRNLMASTTLIQINTNHARRAQDLLLHTLAECGGGIALISEPFNIPDKHPNWMSDPAGSVAIFWLGNDNACNPITSGTGWTAAKWRNIIVMATYLPPSINLEDMETSLEEISDFIKRTPATPILLGGDFNAKSPE
ncbi:hypothetical protein PUN28_020887 [Cardiocondyla obscurior]|uniref:CCHC-type domain-containing protein n=2 Tax=Cardiocondyla obscurior TaxID=286306 RepID=A0AAW2E992_9HYME